MIEPGKAISSPAGAYRADMRGRESPFGPDDDRWLASASALHSAATYPGKPNTEHLYDAIGVAIDILGDERIDQFVDREWLGDRSYIEALAVLSYDIHDAGALQLAALILDDTLRAAPDLSLLHRGRLLAMRARVERKLGHVDEAAERYGFVESLAQESGSAELQVRAEIGFSALAQQRGNLPEMRDRSRRAADIADANGLRYLGVLAYHGLTFTESKAGNLDGAAAAGWRAFILSRGSPDVEAASLQNLGQMLLEHGLPELARATFSAVMLIDVPARTLLPALGGLALASAQTGREATVEWAIREVWRAQTLQVAQYEMAEALLESATGLAILSRDAESRRFADAAHALATLRGFHELVFRADALRQRATPLPASAEAARSTGIAGTAFARDVAALEPERLPSQLRFDAAPA